MADLRTEKQVTYELEKQREVLKAHNETAKSYQQSLARIVKLEQELSDIKIKQSYEDGEQVSLAKQATALAKSIGDQFRKNAVSSEKSLIFHRSSANFGRQTNLFGEFKHEQPFGKKMVYTKVEAVPSSWIFLDAHIKDFQNKETSIHLLPAIKPLDLIYDNPAILQDDYQILNSGGS